MRAPLALALAALASVRAVRTGRHLLEVDDAPTILTVPELRVPRPGFATLQTLPELAHVGLEHNFTGLTDVGFVEYS